MAGLDPAIHSMHLRIRRDRVGPRVKPGGDAVGWERAGVQEGASGVACSFLVVPRFRGGRLAHHEELRERGGSVAFVVNLSNHGGVACSVMASPPTLALPRR